MIERVIAAKDGELFDMRMLHDNMLVKRIPEPEGRIVLLEELKKKTMKAEVLAVGPGRWVDGTFTRTAIKPGDVVLLPGIAAQIPDWENRDLIIVQERDVGGIWFE